MRFIRHYSRTREFIRRISPAITIFLSLLVMALPFPLAWGIMPNLALLGVIIWSSIQPRLLPTWAALLLGIFADLLFGSPLGVWATIFPLVGVIVKLGESRLESHDLAMDWFLTTVLLLFAHLLAWKLNQFANSHSPVQPWIVQACGSALAYPMATWMASRVQRQLVDADI